MRTRPYGLGSRIKQCTTHEPTGTCRMAHFTADSVERKKELHIKSLRGWPLFTLQRDICSLVERQLSYYFRRAAATHNSHRCCAVQVVTMHNYRCLVGASIIIIAFPRCHLETTGAPRPGELDDPGDTLPLCEYFRAPATPSEVFYDTL